MNTTRRSRFVMPGIFCALVILCIAIAVMTTRQPEHPASPQHAAAALEVIGLRVNASIVRFRSVNESTERIAKAFPLILPSLYTKNDASVQFFSDTFDLKQLEQSIELCFIPAELMNPRFPPVLVWYRQDWKSLMIRAVDIPDPVLTAVVFHELYHALADREGRSSASAPEGSEEFVREEVEAHDQVETPVLNAITSGRFSTLLATILARRQRDEQEPKSILALIRPDDITALGEMLQMKDAGQRVKQAMYGQFTFALLAKQADESSSPMEKKISYYRWLQRLPR